MANQRKRKRRCSCANCSRAWWQIQMDFWKITEKNWNVYRRWKLRRITNDNMRD